MQCRTPLVARRNRTFYIGPNLPRPPEQDFGRRAPLFADHFAPNMHHANCVMHASDRAFDFDFDGLPRHHRYVGPLLDDAVNTYPARLDEPGYPWALVTVSSLKQDDIAIAQAALVGLRSLRCESWRQWARMPGTRWDLCRRMHASRNSCRTGRSWPRRV